MRHKHKISAVLAIVILANTLVADFAFAQTPPPPITRADLLNAQNNNIACNALSSRVETMMRRWGTFKTEWNASRPADRRCMIFQYFAGGSSTPVAANGDRNLVVERLEAIIKNNPNGINDQSAIAAFGSGFVQGAGSGAANVAKAATGILLSPFTSLINGLASGIAAFADLAAQVLFWTIDYTKAVDNRPGSQAFPTIVNTGWVIVRDLMNMVFILAMIVMALATILKFEEYSYKKIMARLIVMALLINFSKVIAQELINFSDLLVSVLVQGNTWGKEWGVISKKLILDQTWWDLVSAGGIVTAIQRLILAIIGFITMCTLAILFIIRMVGLWVLVILSPAAYALNVLPQTKDLAKQWWKKFIYYCFWAPVAVLFLRLSDLLLQSTEYNAYEASNTIFAYVIVIVFMWAAVLVAKQAGMVGSEGVLSMAEGGFKKVTSAPFGLAGAAGKGALGFAGRWYSKKTMNAAQKQELKGNTGRAALYKAAAFLNPVVAKKAWDQRSHELEEDVYGPATGYAHDTLNRIMPTEWHRKEAPKLDPMTGKPMLNAEGKPVMEVDRLGRKTNYGAIEYNKVINKKTRDYNEAPLTEEQRVRLYLDATHLEDKIALLRSMVLNRHEDGLAHAIGRSYDSTDFKQYIFDDLSHAGASNEMIGQQMNFISEIAEEGRKIRGLGSGVVDWDGVARASVDLTGLQKLGAQDIGKLQETLRGLNVINDRNEFIDRKGNIVTMNTENGTVGAINSIEDFNNAIEKQIKDPNAQYEGKDFANSIKAARSAKEAIKRLKRTDSEDVAKAIEPAAFARQDADGQYRVLHEEGLRILEMLNPSVGGAIPGMRRTQARAQALVGMVQTADGSYDFEKILAEPDKLNILVETAHEAPEVAAGLMTKGKMTEEVAQALVNAVNARLDHDYRGSKETSKHLDLGGEREGGWQIKVIDRSTPPSAPATTAGGGGGARGATIGTIGGFDITS